MTNETVEQIMNSNVAARFDISDTEAQRIAHRAKTGAEFVSIWENEDWWTDEANQ